MTFRLFDRQNSQVCVPGRMKYELKVYTCVYPYREVEFTEAGTPLIAGEKTVEVTDGSYFEFFNVSFTAGSSKYPNGYFNLVILCSNSSNVEPLVAERINVRLKYKKVMILKNRRKKQSKLQIQRAAFL